MDICTCIRDLLEVHDCVIIPGFGGFIGNYTPAHIDPVHHSFQPPAKKLLFNINLKQNDGLLANAVAAYFGTSYTDACQMIDEFTDSCRTALKSGKSFLIPQVGRLYSGREGTIQFEQDKYSNLLPDAFGFIQFISPPIARGIRPVKAEMKVISGSAVKLERHSALPKVLKWTAILAIPIGVAAVISVSHFDKLKISPASDAGIFTSVLSRFSSTSLVERKEAPSRPPESRFEYDPAPTVFDQPVSGNELINFNTDLRAARPETHQESLKSGKGSPARVTHEPVKTVSHRNQFAVIVGAFRSKENAEKFIGRLKDKGTNASVYDRSKSGLFRVTIGTFSQQEEALQLLASAQAGDFGNAWLLEK